MRSCSPAITPPDHSIGVRELQVAYATERSQPQRIVDLELERITIGPLLEAGELLYPGPWVAERLAELEGFLAAHPDDVRPRGAHGAAGRIADERPAGVTLIGPAFSEPLLLSVGTQLMTHWSAT